MGGAGWGKGKAATAVEHGGEAGKAVSLFGELILRWNGPLKKRGGGGGSHRSAQYTEFPSMNHIQLVETLRAFLSVIVLVYGPEIFWQRHRKFY